MRRVRRAFEAAAVVVALVTPSSAVIAPTGAAAASPSTPRFEPSCGPAAPGFARCFALIRTDIAARPASTVTPMTPPPGYGPADLQSAYALPSASAGSGMTVAVVDFSDLPTAEADLGVYRTQYGLPPCTTANGCFKKVDQNGGSSYPAPNTGWSAEIALDIDMVSAICPNCHILLVETDSATTADLGTGVNTAVSLGAVAVSNSYGGLELSGDGAADTAYYNHPGVAITAATGDYGYDAAPYGSNLQVGVSYPAASQYVVAVGGTSLTRSSNARGWTESAWGDANYQWGAGSGCSLYAAKPSWQADPGCSNRMLADVSAVADPVTGVAIYDSSPNTSGSTGWLQSGGTSASSPIVASVFALAGTPGAGTYPASYLYGAPQGLNDITSGNNDIWGLLTPCPYPYFCSGVSGYDGPTGLGTPNGVSAFRTPTPPGKPTGLNATAGNGSATLSWTAPASDGGRTITAYSVTETEQGLGSVSCNAITATSCTVSSLVNGTEYTFTVHATNIIGDGPESDPSNKVTPVAPTVPGPPTGVTGARGNASVQVSWTAPASNGGSSITGYTVTSDPGSRTCGWSSVALACTVTGLTNGTPYTFTVTATNAVGTGPASSPSAPVTPAPVPDAPTGVTAVRGNGQATVSWTAPASDGGYAISAYTVTSNPGSETCGWTTGDLSCVVTGLANGTPYTFTVTATNAIGTGLASSPSAPVTPGTVPGAPTGVSAVWGNAEAVVSWSAPASNGGYAITAYTVTSNPGSKTCGWSTGPLSCTVTGLTNGTPYTFTVAATNAVGTGLASSPSAPVIPAAVPGAPTSVSAVGLDGSARISWSAPASNGSTITRYTATASPGGKSCTWTSGPLSCTITGLVNHTTYTVRVTATNAVGTGPASSPAVSVTPRVGATYYPLTPCRVKAGLVLTANLASSFAVIGLCNVPAGASAVTGVLTVSGATSGGWLALTPEPNNAPQTSTINFPPADSRSTGVTVPLGSGGKLSVTYGAPSGNKATATLDVTGYFLIGTAGSTYTALTPNRILDSRPTGSGHTNTGLSGVFTAGTARTFQVTGRTSSTATNVPASAIAVTGTLTVTGQTAPGFLTLEPLALNSPPTASLYFPKGDNRATGLTVKLGAGGTLSVTFTSSIIGATTNVIFDVTGYFAPGLSGAMYVPVTPNRLVDTRIKLGITTGAVPNRSARTFTVWNRIISDPTRNVPSGAVAITGTLTVTRQTYAGWLALTPLPNNYPTTSNLNFPKGDNRATGVTVPLSSTGKLSVTYGAIPGAYTHVVFDVTGYFVK